MIRRYPPIDDRVIVAYYGEAGPHHFIYDFCRTPLGSEMRAAKVRAYERLLEALKGQGCETFVWEPVRWQGYREAFYNNRMRGKKL